MNSQETGRDLARHRVLVTINQSINQSIKSIYLQYITEEDT